MTRGGSCTTNAICKKQSSVLHITFLKGDGVGSTVSLDVIASMADFPISRSGSSLLCASSESTV